MFRKFRKNRSKTRSLGFRAAASTVSTSAGHQKSDADSREARGMMRQPVAQTTKRAETSRGETDAQGDEGTTAEVGSKNDVTNDEQEVGTAMEWTDDSSDAQRDEITTTGEASKNGLRNNERRFRSPNREKPRHRAKPYQRAHEPTTSKLADKKSQPPPQSSQAQFLLKHLPILGALLPVHQE